MTHLDAMDMDVTVPECHKKSKPKVPLRLVEWTSKPEMMVQDDLYDFEHNNDFRSNWGESIKFSKAAKVVKELKVKGKKRMVERMNKGKADGIDKEKGKVKVRDGYSTL